MKKIGLLAVLLTAGVLSFAQTSAEQKVIDVYGQGYFNQMSTSDPGHILMLKKYAEFGLKVVPANAKYASAPLLTDIPLRAKAHSTITVPQFLTEYNGGSFNSLEYGLFPSSEVQVYRLSGTSFVLIIEQQRTILEN